MQSKFLCIISVDVMEAEGQLQIIYCAFIKYLKETNKYRTEHRLFIDFMKAYDSVSRQVLCNNLIVFGIAMTLVRVIEMCVIGTCSRVRVGAGSVMLRIENGVKQGDALSSLLYKFASEYAIRRADGNQKGFK